MNIPAAGSQVGPPRCFFRLARHLRLNLDLEADSLAWTRREPGLKGASQKRNWAEIFAGVRAVETFNPLTEGGAVRDAFFLRAHSTMKPCWSNTC